jgi:hypothetical protein
MMEDNGKRSWVIPDTADESAVYTLAQQTFDAQTGALAAVDPEHLKFFDVDMQTLDALEGQTLRKIAQVKRETRPEFQAAKVQALGDEALAKVPEYERARVIILEKELARLRGQVPREPVLSELAQNTDMLRTVYVLSQLGSDVLNDPLALKVAYLNAADRGNVHVVTAIERDPMGRAERALTEEDLQRGKALRNLVASPELAQKISAYEGLVRRYEARFARMQRRLQGEGWSPGDQIAELAKGGAA